ncbi:AHH domain-containing protein [Paenibacillus sp. FA6]|uniref:AHH domain-containing protein n=1 Tax=Paenibacillus sp. FA6 TaxID=3413029 RepID=UPI003F656A0D
MITYDSVVVHTPYSLQKIIDLDITMRPGEHAKVSMKGIVDDSFHVQSTTGAMWQDELTIYDKMDEEQIIVFKGLITSVKSTNVNGVYYVEIESLSASIQLDIQRRKRSFQNSSMTYDALLKSIMQAYPEADISCNIGEGIPIGEPIIQYEETDWEFINRLASHFQQFVTSDLQYSKPKFYFGTPPGKELEITEDVPYTAGKDLVAYHRAGGAEAGLHNTDFFYYEIITDKQYNIGDIVNFRDKQLVVSEKTVQLEEIQLVYSYRLSRQKGIHRRIIHNERLSGVSLEGEVLDVKGEQVKLHLTIDKDQAKSTAHWFIFAPPTGNAMYCMPQIGTNATLYFPEVDGKGAIVTGCIRKNGEECEKSGDPNIRYFGTEHGSEAKLSPTGIDIVSGSKEPLKLTLEDDNGITLTSHKKLLLQADSDIIIHSQKRVVIQAESQVMVVKAGQTSGIAIENEYHILGAQVIAEGSDRTSYPPYADEPLIGTPPPQPEPEPEEKPPFSWKKLAGNVLGALAVVAVVVAVAVVVVATMGAGAVVIGAVAAGAAIAGTAAVVSQAVSDIARGEVSDFGAYGWAALRESTIGAISGAIFGPFGLTSVVGGKMALGAVTNAFESVIRQTMIGEGFSLKTLLGDATIGAVTAGILDSRIVKGIGGAVVNKLSSVAPWIQKGIGSVAKQFSKRVDDLSQYGNKIGQKYMKEARELLDDVATSIKQAGNNLGGPILVPVGGSPNIPNSNVWNSTVPPPSGRQQDFWSEMDQGKKELAERLSKNAERLIPGTPGKVTGGSSTKLGKNMFEEMGVARTTKRTPYQAQHVIPAEFSEHPVLQKVGMDMDHASNGFFLRVPDEYVSSTSRHQGYHSVYSDFVESKLNKIDINQEINIIEKQLFELQQKLRKLQEKGLPLYMKDDYLQKELIKIKSKGMDDYLLNRAINKDEIKPVWHRGGGATTDLWERWFDKL